MSKPPPCGALDCDERATHADASGVGFCATHAPRSFHGDAEPVSESNPFDPWWAASALGIEAGDERWRDLEYGQWPDGEAPRV